MFPADSINGSTQCIDITITDDEILEADETFTVTLTTTTPRVIVGNGQTAVTITADEGILVKRILLELGMGLNFIDVTISLPTMVSVSEGDGTVEVCATISTASDVPINITLTTNDSSPGVYFPIPREKKSTHCCVYLSLSLSLVMNIEPHPRPSSYFGF